MGTQRNPGLLVSLPGNGKNQIGGLQDAVLNRPGGTQQVVSKTHLCPFFVVLAGITHLPDVQCSFERGIT